MKLIKTVLAGLGLASFTALVFVLAIVGVYTLGAFITGGILWCVNYLLYVGFAIHMLPFYKHLILGAVINLIRLAFGSVRVKS